MAEKIEDLPWVKDGIARDEFNAVRGLIRLAHAGYAGQLLEESWVVEGENFPALESLWNLAGNNPDKLTDIMSHPTIRDGISDQEASIVATLNTAADPDRNFEDPNLLYKLLDLEQVTVEERTITLPLAGEMELAIVRTRPGVDHTMDLLEHSVRSIEEFMGYPFPKRQVIYLFALARGGAVHHGEHVTVFVDERSAEEQGLLRILAHEAGHYYWRSTPGWLSEGGATFLESIADEILEDTLETGPCIFTRHIAGLEELLNGSNPPPGCVWCNYSIGERLLRDLYRNMDETAFRQAFRRLYLHTEYNVPNECTSQGVSICHVREAFTTHAPGDTANMISAVIDRWYDNSEPYDLSWINGTPVEAEIAAIDGRIDRTYLSFSGSGNPISAVTAEPSRSRLLFMNLDYSGQSSNGLEHLPIEVALSFEDGFEIRRKQTYMPVYTVGTPQTHYVSIGYEMALGRYWVHAYLGEQKIAEATFETVPPPDPHSIRGIFTAPKGQPLSEIALAAKRGGETFQVEAEPDGAFEVVVSSGSFALEVFVLFDNTWRSVGWYNGKGGITIDPDEAFEVIIDGADVGGINIDVSSISDVSIRGMITVPDGRTSEGIGLQAVSGAARFWTDVKPDGTYNLGLPSGSYLLEVSLLVGDTYHFVGWFDGGGGMTTDRSRAFEVIVDGTDVKEIAMILPHLLDKNIRGVVTGSDGQPLREIGLQAKAGEQSFWFQTGPDGLFHFGVSSATFVVEVHVPKLVREVIHYFFVGWYDGSGGITTNPDEAFEIVVDDGDVEGIEIVLPSNPEDLLCPAGAHRSTVTGRCGS